MHKILVIRLYFLLYALHVSDYISPSSAATLKTVYRIWYMLIHLVVVWLYRRMVLAYTKCDVQLIKLLLKMD